MSSSEESYLEMASPLKRGRWDEDKDEDVMNNGEEEDNIKEEDDIREEEDEIDEEEDVMDEEEEEAMMAAEEEGEENSEDMGDWGNWGLWTELMRQENENTPSDTSDWDENIQSYVEGLLHLDNL